LAGYIDYSVGYSVGCGLGYNVCDRVGYGVYYYDRRIEPTAIREQIADQHPHGHKRQHMTQQYSDLLYTLR